MNPLIDAILKTTAVFSAAWLITALPLRWTAAAMLEAKNGFRRLKAYRQLPMLRDALIAHQKGVQSKQQDHLQQIDKQLKAA